MTAQPRRAWLEEEGQLLSWGLAEPEQERLRAGSVREASPPELHCPRFSKVAAPFQGPRGLLLDREHPKTPVWPIPGHMQEMDPSPSLQALPTPRGSDRCRERMPGCREVHGRAVCVSQTQTTVSSADLLGGRQGKSASSCRRRDTHFPSGSLARSTPGTRERAGSCTFLCGPSVLSRAGRALLRRAGACRDPCPDRSPPAAPLQPPGSQVRSSQTSRNSETERPHPASHWRVRASWGRDGIHSFSLAGARARDLRRPGGRWRPPETGNAPFYLRAATWARGLCLSVTPSSLLIVGVGSPRSSKQWFISTCKPPKSWEEVI